MCGIAGVVLPGDEVPDPDVVRAMTDALAHRGPDGHGVIARPGCTFGHRRLSVIDLSNAAAQPMETADRAAMLTYNGEIYDYSALRENLVAAGETFRSHSDTEVVLNALRRWGTAALDNLHGMFAFGYWNAFDRSLLLARDRFGEKPLYFTALGNRDGAGGVAFASELRALLAHPEVWSRRAVDPASLAQFLTHEFVPAPRSILAGVEKLGPGEILRWSNRHGIAREKYYRPAWGTRMRAQTSVLVDEFTARVDAAVARRLVADVPVGVFLSGGLDSSFIAALAVRHHPKVKTFSIGFEDPSFDESSHAELVAHHLGTEHHAERVSSRALLDLVPTTLAWIDEPHADSSIVPTTLLARLARRHVTVALGGDGGDEVLAGYPTFTADQVFRAFPPSPALSRALSALARLAPQSDKNFSLGFKLSQTAMGLADQGSSRHARWLAAVDPTALSTLFSPALKYASGNALDAALTAGKALSNSLDAATAFYLGVYLSEGVLQKVDRATMRVALEARAPFLDTAVVEFCLALPESLRVRGSTTKRLLRMALTPLVPKSIVSRPKKGFGAPVGAWLRGPLRTLLTDTLAPSRIARVGWFDPSTVSALVDAHLSGRADHRKTLYALLVLETWRSTWMERS